MAIGKLAAQARRERNLLPPPSARRANSRGTLRPHSLSALVKAVREQKSFGCPLCQRETQDWVADHDHATGAPRDFLCRSCNAGLGMFKDNPEALRRAADYLEKHVSEPIGDPVEFLRRELGKVTDRQASRRAAAALSDRAISLAEMTLRQRTVELP